MRRYGQRGIERLAEHGEASGGSGGSPRARSGRAARAAARRSARCPRRPRPPSATRSPSTAATTPSRPRRPDDRIPLALKQHVGRRRVDEAPVEPGLVAEHPVRGRPPRCRHRGEPLDRCVRGRPRRSRQRAHTRSGAAAPPEPAEEDGRRGGIRDREQQPDRRARAPAPRSPPRAPRRSPGRGSPGRSRREAASRPRASRRRSTSGTKLIAAVPTVFPSSSASSTEAGRTGFPLVEPGELVLVGPLAPDAPIRPATSRPTRRVVLDDPHRTGPQRVEVPSAWLKRRRACVPATVSFSEIRSQAPESTRSNVRAG